MSNLHLRASAAKPVIEIERPVGPALRAADLHAVRDALAQRGLCRRSIRALTRSAYKPDLAAALRTFQRRHGLEIDGIVLPCGPTERALANPGDVAGVTPADEPRIRTECEHIARAADEIDREMIHLSAEIERLSARMAQLRERIDATSSEQEARRLSRELDETQREWLRAHKDFVDGKTERVRFVRRYASLACPAVLGFRLPPPRR